MNDINLFYYGGSGGFFCLHLLLLTKKYNCIFIGDSQNFDEIFKHQWNIKSIAKWKQSETWPANGSTLASNLDNRIFFHCNSEYTDYNKYPGTKVLLYTDFYTQYYMTRTKRAFWFVDTQFSDEYYNKIRGHNWPDCKNNNDFKKLPKWIQQECIEKFNFNVILGLGTELEYEKYAKELKTVDFRGIEVYHKVKEVADQGIDIAIKLQDLIQTNGDILFDQLGIEGNQQCKDFIEMYLNLHTEEQKKLLTT